MGCCGSSEVRRPEPTRVRGDALQPIVSTAGPHPTAMQLEGKRMDAKQNIKIACGGLFIARTDDCTIDVLFVYPDNKFSEMPPATQGIDEAAVAPTRGAEAPSRAPWQSILVELKEFDSPDDIIKEWYQDAGMIPGLQFIEPAGALGAWARLEPHCYQQRFVLPNGRRVAHPLVDPEFKPPMYVSSRPAVYEWPPDATEEDKQKFNTEPIEDEYGYFDDGPACKPDWMPGTSLSVPQRLYRAYNEGGGREMLEKMASAIDSAIADLIRKAEAKGEAAGIPDGLSDKLLDAAEQAERGTLINWTPIIDMIDGSIQEFQTYQTVHQFPDELAPLRMIFAEIEDDLVYNWFSVTVGAQMQVGKYVNEENKASKCVEDWELDKTVWDWLLVKTIEKADDKCKQVLHDSHVKLSRAVRRAAKKYFRKSKPASEEEAKAEEEESDSSDTDSDFEEDDTVFGKIFPDMQRIIDATLGTVQVVPLGLADKVASNTEIANRNDGKAVDVEKIPDDQPKSVDPVEDWVAKLDELRAEDAAPLPERRARFYKSVAEEMERLSHAYRSFWHETGGDPSKQTKEAEAYWELLQFCRIPKILPQRFFKFTFYLVFPRFGEEDESDAKCPNEALLKLWPEGADNTRDAFAPVKMTEFDLPIPDEEELSFAEKAEEKVRTMAVRTLDGDGDSSIDSGDDEDPRNAWRPYPSKEFRGFECTVEAAVDVTYFFHFILDGSVFVDHDSYVKQGSGEVHARKVRFIASANTFTVNPLKVAGLVL